MFLDFIKDELYTYLANCNDFEDLTEDEIDEIVVNTYRQVAEDNDLNATLDSVMDYYVKRYIAQYINEEEK